MRSLKYYKKITTPDGRSMDEHRYKMELKLGRRLTRFEVVHHKDGNINNNEVDNLELMSLGEHTRLHLTGREHFGTNVKVSNKQVIEIKKKFLKGYSLKDLAKLYNVHYSAISLIVNLKSFAHIDHNGLNNRLIKSRRPNQLCKYKQAS